MANLVAIDSMIFTWAVKNNPTKGQEGMVPLANNLLDWLDSEKVKILLPAPVITEMIAPITDPKDIDRFMEAIYARFRIGALSDLAARKAGEIWNKTPNWKEIYGDAEGIKNRFKYDILILGITAENRAECLYSEDKNFQKLGERVNIKVKPMPKNLFTPRSLFEQNG